MKYMPRTSVKGQILANLVAKFAEPALKKMSTTQKRVENQLAQSPYKNLLSGKCMLIEQQIKGAQKWG